LADLAGGVERVDPTRLELVTSRRVEGVPEGGWIRADVGGFSIRWERLLPSGVGSLDAPAKQFLDSGGFFFDAVGEGESRPTFALEEGLLRSPVFFEAQEDQPLPTPAAEDDPLRKENEALRTWPRIVPHVVPLPLSTGGCRCPNFAHTGCRDNVNRTYLEASYRRHGALWYSNVVQLNLNLRLKFHGCFQSTSYPGAAAGVLCGADLFGEDVPLGRCAWVAGRVAYILC
jgi:hypothetical protein